MEKRGLNLLEGEPAKDGDGLVEGFDGRVRLCELVDGLGECGVRVERVESARDEHRERVHRVHRVVPTAGRHDRPLGNASIGQAGR